MSETEPPIRRLYDLNRLSEAGYETRFVLGPEERTQLAEWADVESVEQFEAVVTLQRLSPTRFHYHARLEASLTQLCTVSLEPVASHVERDFSRTLHLVARIADPLAAEGEISLAAGDDDAPEDIDDPRYDLAAPLLEELVLAIDPYPRAPGVVFEPPPDAADAPESPFAVLGRLKGQN